MQKAAIDVLSSGFNVIGQMIKITTKLDWSVDDRYHLKQIVFADGN